MKALSTRTTLACLGLACVLAMPAAAPALEKEYVTAPAGKIQDDAGWLGSLRVGAGINFMNNRKVVGQLDGSQFTLGFSFDGDIGYRKGEHDWRNNLTIQEGFGYGPPINKVVKSSDTLKFDTAYFYHPEAAPWVGPFVRAGLLSAIFEGAHYNATKVTYNDAATGEKLNGNPADPDDKTDQFHLSDEFSPTTLKESAGVFLNPYRHENLDIMILAGFGSHQVFAEGQYALADDAKTAGQIEVKKLSSFVQAGFEGGLALTGTAYESKIKYKAYTDVMVPFYRSNKPKGDKSSIGDMTNVEMGALLSFKLVDWASVDYTLKVLRQPQLVKEWQVQNLLLLNFSYSYAKRQIPPAPPPAPAAPAAN